MTVLESKKVEGWQSLGAVTLPDAVLVWPSPICLKPYTDSDEAFVTIIYAKRRQNNPSLPAETAS
jgi:hypothetical protein